MIDLVGHDVPVPELEKLVAVTGVESHPSLERLVNEVNTGNNIGLVAIQIDISATKKIIIFSELTVCRFCFSPAVTGNITIGLLIHGRS